MFENFSNVIFIAVALAVFIGRTVSQARKNKEAKEQKKAAPPPPPSPKIQALHFEEKDNDELGYFKKAAAQPASKAVKPPVKASLKKQPPSLLTKASTLKKDTSPPVPSNIDKLFPVKGTARTLSSEQEGFSFNLDHLSPMKQAVIMAEILGPPKGLTDR